MLLFFPPVCLSHRRLRPLPWSAGSSCMWWNCSVTAEIRDPPSTSRRLSSLVRHGTGRDKGNRTNTVHTDALVSPGDDLYDVTLTDGDCRLRVTLDPSLNRLVERNVLQPGSQLRHATFTSAMAAQLPECPGASGERDR